MVIGAGAADAGVDDVAIKARGRPATAAARSVPIVRTPDGAQVLEISPSRTCRLPPPDSSESLATSMITQYKDCENANLALGYHPFPNVTTGQYELTGFVTVTRS